MIVLRYNIRGLGKKKKMRDHRKLIQNVKADVCHIQESKPEQVTKHTIKAVWGNNTFDWDFVKSDGSLGGIIMIWNPSVFTKTSSWGVKELLVMNGFLVEDGKWCSIFNVYAPNILTQHWVLWDQMAFW